MTERVTGYGVVLALYPGDATFWMEVERAPDVGGNPDESSAEILQRVPPSSGHFTDVLPASDLFYHYRMYHVGDGFDPSFAPTAWIRARAVPLPERLPLDLITPKPRVDVDLALDNTDGTVDVVFDTELPDGAVKWAFSTTDYPPMGDPGDTTTLLDGSGDARFVDAFTLVFGQTGFVRATFYADAAATEFIATLRVSITRSSAIPGDTGSLDHIDFTMTRFDGYLKVRAAFALEAILQRWELRRDPSNTTNPAWNVLGDAAKEALWDAGVFIDRPAAHIWESPEEYQAARQYSLMAKAIAANGDEEGAVPVHDFAENLTPVAPGTVSISSEGRDIRISVPNAQGLGATHVALHASTSNGFTPSDATRVDVHNLKGAVLIGIFGGGSSVELQFKASDGLAFGTTVYFRLELWDHLTQPLGETPTLSSQFSHVLSQIPGAAVVSLEPGSPNGTLTPTGIALTVNSNGSADYQLQWTFTQGSIKADMIVLFAVEGLSAPTIVDDALLLKADAGSGRHYTLKNLDTSKFWSFGVAMGRRTVNGVEISTILSPTSSPDWRGVTPLGNDFTDAIAGTGAATVEGGAARANQGLDSGGNLTADINGDTNVINNGRLFIPTGGGLPFGSSGSPTTITRTVIVPYSAFLPDESSYAYHTGDGYIYPDTPASIFLTAQLVVPVGSTIVQLRARMYRQTSSDLASASMLRHTTSGGFPTNFGSAIHSTTGWQTSTANLSQLVSQNHAWTVGLILDLVTNDLDVRFAWAEVDYTVPDHRVAV